MGLSKLASPIVALGLTMVAHGAEAACNLVGGEPVPVIRSGGYSEVAVKINGADAHLILDSGAYYSEISPAAEARLKLPPTVRKHDFRDEGVGGVTGRVGVLLAKDFTLVSTTFSNAEFELGERQIGDADGLLGENFLAAETVEYDLSNNVIRFFLPQGCATEPLAYWAKTQPYSVADIDRPGRNGAAELKGYAWVNGVKLRVTFDTGAPYSIMSLAAAERTGVRPYDSGVFAAGRSGGIARNSNIPIWNAAFASFKLGDEEIRNPRIFIGPLGLDDVDMLLGADFFRSHRVIVSHAQNKLYFTYSGGQVFAASLSSAMTHDDKPLDAQGLSRRASQEAFEQNYDAALADMNKAIALDPKSWAYVFQRGQINRRRGKPDLALADFDQALALEPGAIAVLLDRSTLKFGNGDKPGAKVDIEKAALLADHQAKWGLALGDSYSDEDGYEFAIPWLDLWIAGSPEDRRMPAALNSRCWARAVLGRELTKALADCNASLKLMPGEPNTLDSRGLVRLKMGDFDGALADYNAALAAHPGMASAYFGRALAEEGKGMAAEGEEDERRAKRLDANIAATFAKHGLRPSL